MRSALFAGWTPLSVFLHIVAVGAVAGGLVGFHAMFPSNDGQPGGLPSAEPQASLEEVPIEPPTQSPPPDPPAPPLPFPGPAPPDTNQPVAGPIPIHSVDAGAEASAQSRPEKRQTVARLAGLGTLPGTAISATFDVATVRTMRVTTRTLLNLVGEASAVKAMFHGSPASLDDCMVAAVLGPSMLDDDTIAVCEPGPNWSRFTALTETSFTRSTHPERPLPIWRHLGAHLAYARWPYGDLSDRVLITIDHKYLILGRAAVLQSAMTAYETLPARTAVMMDLSIDGHGDQKSFLLLRMTNAFVIPSPACGTWSSVLWATRSTDVAEETRVDAQIAFHSQAAALAGERCVRHDEGIQLLRFDFPQPPGEGVMEGVTHLKDDDLGWKGVEASLDVDKIDVSFIVQRRRATPDAALPSWGPLPDAGAAHP